MRKLLRKVYRWIRPAPVPDCDAETIEVLRHVLREDSCTIDVGCNRGSILREIVRLAPHGRHFAFEPIPSLHRLLQRRFPGVDCRQLAISDTTGTITFHHFTEMDGFSGFVRRRDVPNNAVTLMEVPTARLDDLFPSDLKVDLIKIDVEGAELRVMHGGIESLRRWRPTIVFECGKGGLDIHGHCPEDVYDLLNECGLRIQPLAEWTPAGPPLSREAFCEHFWSGRSYMFVATPPQGTA